MRSLSAIGRVAAVGAVIAAIVLVGLILFGGGGAGGYKVKARFLNAGQLVKGNPVQVGGVPVGSVKGIKITDDGHAEIEMSIDGDHAPAPARHARRDPPVLPVRPRQPLRRPEAPAGHGRRDPDGGVIETDKTVTQVDLDELYNTLDPETRRSLQGFFKGSADQWRDLADEANVGFEYLNPALSTSRRLFNELTRTRRCSSASSSTAQEMVTALAERRDDLAALIGNLNDDHARARQPEGGARRVDRPAPAVHAARQHDVREPRSTLDEVDPLVEASKPVAKRLQPFLSQARAFAADAEPTVRDLSLTIRARRANDLINLLHVPAAGRDRDGRPKQRSYAPGGTRHRWARRAAPSRRPWTRSRAAPARSASRGRTRPTSSAGSTTSRRPAAASTPSAPPRAASSRCRRSCTRTRWRRSSTSAARARPRRRRRTARTCSRPRSEAARLRRGGQGGAEVRRVLIVLACSASAPAAFVLAGASDQKPGGPHLQDRVRQRLRPHRRAATSAWAA